MALRDQPYLPLYVMDFLSDEKLVNCSAESTGVYIRLMCILHKMQDYGSMTLRAKEKQSKNNIRNFAFKLHRQMPYDVDCIERSLSELIDERVVTLDGDRLYQKRMVKDGEISLKRSQAGAKGGRRAKSEQKNEQNENENLAKAKLKPEAGTKGEKVDLISERFDAFWKAYPRKTGKGSARKSWAKIAPSKELFEKIMEALREAKSCEQWKKDKGQFIPYPTTWLNQERWDDEYDMPNISEREMSFDPDDNPYADWSDNDG